MRASASARAEPNLYGLVQALNFNELLTCDLTQKASATFGYEPPSLIPLNFTNLLPQNGVVGIAVSSADDGTGGGGGGGATPVPGPSTWALMLTGFTGLSDVPKNCNCKSIGLLLDLSVAEPQRD
jgi:hypothetical protein